MPTKITLVMAAERDLVLPKFTGHIARALFLHAINRVNPSLAQHLHQANILKPYTVEPLYFKSKAKSHDGYIIDAAHPCKLVIKLLRDDLFEEVGKYFASTSTIMIRDTTLLFQEAQIHSKDYASIMREAEDVVNFDLNFITPTYLSKSKSEYFYLFPEPRRIFMNLLRIWNAFSPVKVDKNDYKKYWRWLEEKVGVYSYDLNTVPIKIERAKAKVGFIGSVGYILKDDTYSKLTDALIKFSEFSNVGGGRTAGMGVVRIKDRRVVENKT